jgi:hypothetical protein
VTSSGIDEVLCWLTRVDHETVGEFHALGTSSTELARDDNFATLSTALHDETKDTIASAANSETIEEFVSEGFALCDGGKTSVLDLGRVERDGVFWELESLLNERGEFADSSSLLAENFLGVGRSNDDIGDGGCDTDFDSRVSFLSKFALEELVQFGVEDTICDELSPLRAVRRVSNYVFVRGRGRGILHSGSWYT